MLILTVAFRLWDSQFPRFLGRSWAIRGSSLRSPSWPAALETITVVNGEYILVVVLELESWGEAEKEGAFFYQGLSDVHFLEAKQLGDLWQAKAT